MRLFAEERRSGTIETLLTAPVGNAGVVLGKFAAALVTYVAMWLPTVLYIVVLAPRGRHRLARRGHELPRRLAHRRRLPRDRHLDERHDPEPARRAHALVARHPGALHGRHRRVRLRRRRPRTTSARYVSVWAQMGELSKGIVDLRRLVLRRDAHRAPAVHHRASGRCVEVGMKTERRIGQAARSGRRGRGHDAGRAGQRLRRRHYRRWDLTTNRLYTLSPATLQTLHALGERVDVDVVLSSGDPLANSVKFLLDAYQAESERLGGSLRRSRSSSRGSARSAAEIRNRSGQDRRRSRGHRCGNHHVARQGQSPSFCRRPNWSTKEKTRVLAPSSSKSSR